MEKQKLMNPIMNQETMRHTLSLKTKYMWKMAKHSARQQKLKDTKAVRNNESGEGETHGTETYPTESKIDVTMKITLASCYPPGASHAAHEW